jgi:hypothetical protein
MAASNVVDQQLRLSRIQGERLFQGAEAFAA